MDNKSLKRVLVITYYWPPAGGAGVQRWLKFVKYFREFGVEPVVYTPTNPELPAVDHSLLKDIPVGTEVIGTEIWEPYSFYKKFTGRRKEDGIGAGFISENKKPSVKEKLAVWLRGNLFIPDARRFWIRPSISYLTEYLKKNPVDAIISTGPPHSMHLIARGIKKRFPEIKWMADFRDPWTNIDFYEDLMVSKAADRKHRKLEAAVLTEADIVVSVGATMNEEFKEIWSSVHQSQQVPDKFKVVTNGYDDADVSSVPVALDSKFSIAHIGTLNRSRNPEVLWKVLGDLVQSQPDFARKLEIKLVGKVDVLVRESIERCGLADYVNKIDYLPHDEVMRVQRSSHVLLLLVNRTKNAKGILTGKFFEYMAAGRPVLAIGPNDGDLAVIMNETKCGLISDFDDADNLRSNIMELFNKANDVSATSNISEYSRRNLTKKIAALLFK
jgi:glycosyltransferase involved in cell wall biosynthesis